MAANPTQTPGEKVIPGEAGLWIFIIGDMLVFSLFFLVFLHYRAADVETFSASRALLNQNLGVLNTLLLLTSSWFVVSGVHAVRISNAHHAGRFFRSAMLCGFGFVLIKYLEYSAKISEGYTLMTNDFFMYYYIFTGIHLIHVLIGLGVLYFMIRTVKRSELNGQTLQSIECGGIFWHMVDLLWIVLFPLLYLV